jgi:hypothetical protein
LAASTTKKVVVRRFDREPLTGFVSTHTYQQPSGIELLKPEGDLTVVSYSEIKTVCFVRDFDGFREPLEARLFQTRPKMEGLWVRMKFRDGDVLDGILPNNLLLLDRQGFTFTPPEPYSNNQRVFVPREALLTIEVLSVVGSALRKVPAGRRVKAVDAAAQPGLFEQEAEGAEGQ